MTGENAVRLRRVNGGCVADVRVRLVNVVVPERNENAAASLLSMSNNGAEAWESDRTAMVVPAAG